MSDEQPIPEDKPAQPVRQVEPLVDRNLPYTDREWCVIREWEYSDTELRQLRAMRDDIEDKIRVFVGEEYRLRRMVRIVERAYQEGNDEPQADD